MKSTALMEPNAPAQAGQAGNYELNVAIVYEDGPTRQWARQVCERVAKVVGQEAVRRTWWKMSDLSDPAVLAGAVSTAMRADVIVVAIRAAEMLSLPFYVWVDSWLPHRWPGSGALVALVGQPEWLSTSMDQAREYLRAVARKGRLDFLIEERRVEPENVMREA